MAIILPDKAVQRRKMSPAITDSTLLSLAGGIYEAAIEPERWTDFLQEFARSVQGQGTLIFSHNVETMEANTEHDPSSLSASVNFDPTFVHSLASYYNTVNVWAKNESVLKPGRPVTGSMLYPVRELPKTEFYNEWLKPQDFFHALGGLVVQDGPWAIKFSSMRAQNAGDYTRDELRLYKELLPHLARATRIQRRLAFLQSLSTSSLSMLDTVPSAVFLMDASRRVLHVNSAAERELRLADPLSVSRSGELHARGTAKVQAALRGIIMAGLEPVRGAKEDIKPFVQLFRKSGHPIFIQSIPLPITRRRATSTMIGQRLAAFALVVHGRVTPVQTIAPQLLRHVYQLTPAEVQIALAIADGETPKTYAQRRDISVNTASAQLKRVFSKTGLKRQNELVRWLLMFSIERRPRTPR